MSTEETVNKIQRILASLKAQEFEPSEIIYHDPNIGRIVMSVENLTEEPEVVFKVRRKGEAHPQVFTNLRIAFVYLFRQTPHIQRKER